MLDGLAEKYAPSVASVRDIRDGRTFRHLPPTLIARASCDSLTNCAVDGDETDADPLTC